MKRVRLKKPLRERIVEGHPWIYDRAIELPPDLANGDVVEIVDDKGPIAKAFVEPGSPIRARVLPDDPIAAVREAVARRARDPLLVGCTGVRLVHGEGDRCPGLVVDKYADTACIVFDGPAAAAYWTPRLSSVIDALEVQHAWVRERGKKSAGQAAKGDPPALIEIREDEARFGVDVRAGQKTGFFLDQRDNRRTIAKHARDLEVANLYCYTGGFSLHAALGGAARVTSVDIAAPAIAALADNLVRSGLGPGKHELVTSDVPEFLARSRRRWDLVICDPPSFVPNEKSRQSGLPAYRKLFEAALAAVRPGGRLAFASCSSHVTEQDLIEIASRSGPNVRLRALAGAASDHPVTPAFPEGRYLKFLFFDIS